MSCCVLQATQKQWVMEAKPKISQAKTFDNQDLKSNTWEKLGCALSPYLNAQDAKMASCQVPSSETTCEWQCLYASFSTWLHSNWVWIHRFILHGFFRTFHELPNVLPSIVGYVMLYYIVMNFLSFKQNQHICVWCCSSEGKNNETTKVVTVVTGSDHAEFLPAVDVEALELLSSERNWEVSFGPVEGCGLGIMRYGQIQRGIII